MDIFSLLDEIQTIARNGLNHDTPPYDRERYERLLKLAAQTYSEIIDIPIAEIRSRLLGEMGYITPKVGTDAAIFNERGEILLMERADGSGWCLPCGWVEPNEKPAEAVIREVREETGLEVKITRLVGVFTRKASAGFGPHSMIAIVHLCEIIGGELTLSHEGSGLKYLPIDEVTDWHATQEKYARAALEMWRADTYNPAISD